MSDLVLGLGTHFLPLSSFQSQGKSCKATVSGERDVMCALVGIVQGTGRHRVGVRSSLKGITMAGTSCPPDTSFT